ncbi:unnamed protein product [Euphydryas editha]|uniref:Uncharacterized protein n=1 Tax=Euphydryas editha TaxID=104508 RepID=A0AAU9V4A3_EUPED|nr:unnamed protein product [Euphydryas editha]
MEIMRYIFIITLFVFTNGKSTTDTKIENTTHNCPFTRIIEDIFNINNKTSNVNNFNNKTSLYSNLTNSFISSNKNITQSIQDELVNDIIASIRRIKANLTLSEDHKLNEAIILSVPKNNQNTETDSVVVNKKVNQIKSGIEDKVDISNINSESDKHETDNLKPTITKPTRINNNSNKPNYVEILTIEPNNTSNSNTSTHSILEVLKNLMPSLNSSINKDLHSITIIEKNQNKNHSYTETKNISTIIVKYCDNDNTTKNETSNIDEPQNPDEDMKAISSPNEPLTDDDYDLDDDTDYEDVYEENISNNRSTKNDKDVLEAAEYGLQKMHELYGILEPKLYSMGLWLNEKDPARYVAAFNAPSEDVAKYSRYGYASLQAASRLKQLIR